VHLFEVERGNDMNQSACVSNREKFRRYFSRVMFQRDLYGFWSRLTGCVSCSCLTCSLLASTLGCKPPQKLWIYSRGSIGNRLFWSSTGRIRPWMRTANLWQRSSARYEYLLTRDVTEKLHLRLYKERG